MPNYRVTFFFESVQAADYGASAALGWTESYYLQDPGNVDSIFRHADVVNYQTYRLACLASLYRLSFIRVNDADNPRLVKIKTVLGGDGAKVVLSLKDMENGLATPSKMAAQVQCGLLVDFQRLPNDVGHHEPVHHRRMIIRGLNADIIAGNVINTNSSLWKSMKRFLDFVGQHETGTAVDGRQNNATALGCRYLNPVTTVPQPVSAITNDPTGHYILFQPDIPTFSVNNFPNTIQIFGNVDNTRYNRHWTFVTRTAGTPIQMLMGRAKKNLPPLPYTFPGPARFRVLDYLLGPFSQYTVIGLRSKRTGKLFRQLRGRATSRS